MNSTRRTVLRGSIAAALVAPLSACVGTTATPIATKASAIVRLSDKIVPITIAERRARIVRAQQLMQENGIAALLLEPGSAMVYFSGVSWWRSERLTAVVIPASGDVGVVTPYFEAPSVRESIEVGDDVRTWHEHESPFAQVQALLSERGITQGKIALEASVRHFVANGLKQELPNFEVVDGETITRGCRMYKTANELRLMRVASEMVMAAYAYVIPQVREGMTGDDIKAIMSKAMSDAGGQQPWALVLVGPASAYPHGTGQQEPIKHGDIVLMDCGCQAGGYQADISRTFVVGEANARQREVWQQVRRGQQVAFEAAQLGRTAGSVDDAVRGWYESLGYGPNYQTPGLSHRTGHGIGMDGHEPVNFVHAEKTLLAPGMCFSNEPGLYDFSAFGVRLEDCLYMTETGPQWFTVPPDSIDEPLGTMGPVI